MNGTESEILKPEQIEQYEEKMKVMDGLIETGVLNAFDGDIDMTPPLDWDGLILKAISETGHSFTRLEKIGVMEICRGLIPQFTEENIAKLVGAIVEEVNAG